MDNGAPFVVSPQESEMTQGHFRLSGKSAGKNVIKTKDLKPEKATSHKFESAILSPSDFSDTPAF